MRYDRVSAIIIKDKYTKNSYIIGTERSSKIFMGVSFILSKLLYIGISSWIGKFGENWLILLIKKLEKHFDNPIPITKDSAIDKICWFTNCLIVLIFENE